LRSAQLFTLQEGSQENRVTLGTQIASGCRHWSVSEREILALARAIVRRSKLLILEEELFLPDCVMDAVPQHSLRQELDGGVTILTTYSAPLAHGHGR
ncbi:hypothetical protein FOMPIDRAFT_1122788, partial [Fomitopsis schrenkii]